MASPLWSRANGRVEEYRKSVLSVHENLLHVKGFLGENIGSMRGMSSVGARAARAAGVIVDADGKLRCPPGTPNANQFTDYRMSNCFAPGAGAARRIARRIASQISESLAAARQLMRRDDNSELTTVRTLAALSALDSIDYTNMDQPEVFSALARITAEMQGNAGSKFVDAALSGLERRGKLEPEERVELATAANNVAVASRPKLISRVLDALGSSQRGKDITNFGKKPDKPDYPNVARRVGSQMKAVFDSKRFEKKVKEHRKKIIETYLPGRDENQDSVQLAEDLRQAMGFGRENHPPDSPVQSKSVDEMLEDSLDSLIGDPATGQKGELERRVTELEQVVDQYGRQQAILAQVTTDAQWQQIANSPHNKGKTIDDLKRERDLMNYDFQKYQQELTELKAVLDQLKRAQTSGSVDTFREQLKKKLADKFVDSLVGVDSALEGHPELRGKVLVSMFPNTDEFKPDALGMDSVLGMTLINPTSDGQVTLSVVFNPTLFLSDTITGPNLAKGQLNHWHIAVSGTSTGSLMTGSHEGGHVLQAQERLAAMGLRLPIDDDTVLTQLENFGPNVSDTFPGLLAASLLGIDPSLSWADARAAFDAKQANLPANRRISFDAAVTQALVVHTFGNGSGSLALAQQDMSKAMMFADRIFQSDDVNYVQSPAGFAGPIIALPSTDEARANPQKIREAVVRTVLMNYNLLTAGGVTPGPLQQRILFDQLRTIMDIDPSVSTLDDFGRMYLGDILDNQTLTEFLEEGQQIFWGDEVPFREFHVPGMTDEHLKLFADLSTYAASLPIERQSEAQSLLTLMKIAGDSMRRDDPRLDEVRKIMAETLPPRPDGKPDPMRPAPEGAGGWVKKTQDMLSGGSIPAFKQDVLTQNPVNPTASQRSVTSPVTSMAVRGTLARGVVSSILDRVVDRSGADEDTKEKVRLGLRLAAGFSAGGPPGAASVLALEVVRRGGRDLAEFTLDEMVKRGKITPEQARLAMAAVDRVAPDGLPEGAKRRLGTAFSEAADLLEEVNTPENRARLVEMSQETIDSAIDKARAAGARARELGESARETAQELGESARELTQDARERARELGESARDRVQDVRETARDFRGALRERARGLRRRGGGSEGEDTDGEFVTRSAVAADPAAPLPPREFALYKPSGEVDKPVVVQETEMITQAKQLLNEQFTSESIPGEDVFTPKIGSYGEGEEMSVRTWEINGEKIQFTNPDYGTIDDPSVTRVARSVTGITGLDPASPEGFELAQKYSAALYASELVDAHDPTYVDALLYSASRGDARAQEELDELAKIGEQLIADMKKLRSDALIARGDQNQGEIDRTPSTRGVEFEDLYAFHETQYDLEIDEEGNLRLYPTGHFHQETGAIRRPTIHTSINHTADGVFGRPEGGAGAKRVVMFKVGDAMRANPDSLENLYAVDTYFVPKPGEPLIIPADQFRVVEYAGEDGEVTEESRKGALASFWTSEEEKTREGDDGIRRFTGGTHYSDPAQDALLARFAGERDVTSSTHQAEHGFPPLLDSTYDAWELAEDGSMIKQFKEIPTGLFAKLSRNARAQVLSHGDYSGENATRATREIADDDLPGSDF